MFIQWQYFIHSLRCLRNSFQMLQFHSDTRHLPCFPTIQPLQLPQVTKHNQIIILFKSCIINSFYSKNPHPGWILHKMGIQFISGLHSKQLSHRRRNQNFIGRRNSRKIRITALPDMIPEKSTIIQRIHPFQHYPVNLTFTL